MMGKAPEVSSNDAHKSDECISSRTRSRTSTKEHSAKWQETVKAKMPLVQFMPKVQLVTFERYRHKNRRYWTQTRACAKANLWWVRQAIKNKADWWRTNDDICDNKRVMVELTEANISYLQAELVKPHDCSVAEMVKGQKKPKQSLSGQEQSGK